jgi:tetratricopeptide (TPR) repeat protein
MIRSGIVFIALASSAMAQDWSTPLVQSFQARQAGREDRDYQKGLSELDARRWEQAIAAFDAAAGSEKSVADAALYWKAYAQNRAGRREEALATIEALRGTYPSSRWVRDAKALEVEVRAKTGAPVNPGAESDEELKLLALNSLMQSDPDKALPVLQKLLAGNNSDKIKEKALFVLTQNSSPEARKVLGQMARNSSNPELQRKAIRYMGLMGNAEARAELVSIYNSSSSPEMKHEILKSFMQSGSRDFLFTVAKAEQNPDLRRDAIKQLALTGGTEQLWQLYQSENSVENKREILKSMFLTGNSTRLAEAARTEKDPSLRVAAIKSLGLMGGNGRADVLVSIYQSDQNREVREAVLNALFLQNNGKALVDLARAEKDPQMKQEVVKKMSLVHSKEVTEYMMEILK